MDFKQLKYFKAIVEEGTISAAARRLHMSQPPLSYQMKMLEEELQVQLFLRGTKRITLTEAGKVLYARAGSLLTMTDITKREVARAGQAVTLHLGMTPSTVSMMTKMIADFSRIYPEIYFDIHEGSTYVLKNQLENRVVDVTTLRTPISLSNCQHRVLVRESLVAMGVSRYMPSDRNVITLKQLSSKKLILSHRYREYLLRAFEKEGLSCDIYYECADARTAMELAENGVGVAILPASTGGLTKKMEVYTIENADLMTELLLVWRNEKIPPEVEMFIEFCQKNKFQ